MADFTAETTDQLDDDVPVYEPVYEDHDVTCSHVTCSNETEYDQRICDECNNIMKNTMLDECPHCGTTAGRGSY